MLKILIAEDDRELCRLFAHVLIKNGYSVKEVSVYETPTNCATYDGERKGGKIVKL